MTVVLLYFALCSSSKLSPIFQPIRFKTKPNLNISRKVRKFYWLKRVRTFKLISNKEKKKGIKGYISVALTTFKGLKVTKVLKP